jgi:aminocarboxymuconate-semialdehyde decarboxylase
MQHRPENRAMVMIGEREFRLVDHRCWDGNRRVADMDEADVGIQVVSPMPELLSYWLDVESTLLLSRHVNAAISGLVAKAPTRFVGLGMVPLQDPQAAAKELSRLKDEFGLSGVEIGSNINGRPPGDPTFDVFFAEAERLGMSIFVHALHPAARDRLIGPAPLVNFVLFPTDIGLAAASFITTGVFQKYPNLRLGFSHGGGMLCSFIHRLESGWKRYPSLNGTFESPLKAARRFYYDNIVFDRRLLHHLVNVFGVAQIFVGSDYPFTGGQDRSAEMFDAIGLSEADMDNVRFGNAARFLNLDVAAGR